MGMSTGSSGGATPNINVTPLIDVLLVLHHLYGHHALEAEPFRGKSAG
jgi:hypothetical protein